MVKICIIKLAEIKFKIWRVTFFKSFLLQRNYGMDFQLFRNNGNIKCIDLRWTLEQDQSAPRGAVWSESAVSHSICIFWTYYSMVEPHCLNFRITTAIFWVWVFKNFNLWYYMYYTTTCKPPFQHISKQFDKKSNSFHNIFKATVFKQVCWDFVSKYPLKIVSIEHTGSSTGSQYTFEPHREKTCLQGFRSGKTQTSLLRYRV